MKDIEIIEYYIFVDNSDVKLRRYSCLEELVANAKKYIDDMIGKSNVYIGIGADFWIKENDSKEFASLDLINRKVDKERFSFCKDIEKLQIRLPEEVKEKFKGLITVL